MSVATIVGVPVGRFKSRYPFQGDRKLASIKRYLTSLHSIPYPRKVFIPPRNDVISLPVCIRKNSDEKLATS
jgi:hypothetical protein